LYEGALAVPSDNVPTVDPFAGTLVLESAIDFMIA
jgi:hypothetical protein